MLQFKQSEKREKDTLVFSAFDLVIKANQIVAICSNVNIRQQLIKILENQTRISSGDILVNGELLNKTNRCHIQIYRLYEPMYDRLTVKETLQFMKRLTTTAYDIETLTNIVRLEDKLEVKAMNLSHSESKRVQLALLLMTDSPIYIFEEPDQNLDLESKQILNTVLQLLKERDKSICILTSNMESALDFSNTVYRLDQKGINYIDTEQEDVETTSEYSTIQSVRFEKIPTKIDDKIVLFDPLEIDYIESLEGKSHLYVNGESFPSTVTLNDLEARLSPFGFFRCHRSYIVNLQKVREVITWSRNSYSLTLDDQKKTTIPLSKAKLNLLKETLGM